MSNKESSITQGSTRQDQQRGDNSVDAQYRAEQAVDRELNRLFKDFWEDTDPAKVLAARRKRDIHCRETSKAVDSMKSNLRLHFLHSNS
jgi:phosphatidylserine/phosphatidylglycerophosphate/cardiolipin synthase-like enzyme